MESDSIQGADKQPRAPDFERITRYDQLTSAEQVLILQSRAGCAAGVGKVVDVDIFPDARLRRRLAGSYVCPQCGGRHNAYLAADGDVIRHTDCNRYVSPDGEKVDGVRLRWRWPEDMPAAMAADIDRPQVDWSPVSRERDLREMAKELRRRDGGALTPRESERLVSIFRRFVRCNEYQAALAERLQGDEARRNIGRAQRDLRREMLRRHVGPGRVTLARKLDAAASVLACLHARGALFW